MHTIEPYYGWRNLYVASEDSRSPFFGYQNSEVSFTDQIYNFVIHPQWDNIGSESLFLKVLYVDYANGFAFLELFGEWNDLINNDIQTLKRDVVEVMVGEGVNKFILIGENLLNFHTGQDYEDYYDEWQEDLEEGWIAVLNMREHILDEMSRYGVDHYLVMGGKLNDLSWRTRHPKQVFKQIDELVTKRLDW
ncbi:hypothetical protein [Algoriphagus machipongonensis]|uniref:Uncharacterized protein n=1 Tax=Algoriphagus machipongonensis TaxID=388413 RepID=A3I1K4_9BACT|nr:hypothetical protein [Algoriphagus machipongonensis]EAZ79670.1 hypothetical protein ALPR1_08598 [Algoriphagus machipongonensis]